MRITEILSNQEQINLVRLIMNTTLNVLGQPAAPTPKSKSPVVQSVKKKQKTVKPAKIPAPPAPKPFPKSSPLPAKPTRQPNFPQATTKTIGPKPVNSEAKIQATLPKSHQALPTSILSPINKKPTTKEKRDLEKENDLIDFLKTAQTTRKNG